MTSLRLRLFALIAAATIIVWSAAAVWTTLSAQRDIERVLDRRLREAAHMVASLGSTAIVAPQPNHLPSAANGYERQLSCQVWSLEGRLIGRSSSAPEQPLGSAAAGFTQRSIDGVEWRVYTYVVPDNGLRVMVGDTLAMRRNLVTDLMTGLIVPAILGLFALGALIWIGTGRGLAPLKRLAEAIEARKPDDLSLLRMNDVPSELTIVTTAINTLLKRLDRMRDAERHFLASAAHELQTPLAGLKTQAEIVARSDDRAVRVKAIKQIEASVERTTRLVRQLLDLARQGGMAATILSPQPLAGLIATVVDQLSPLIERHRTALAIDPSVDGAIVIGDGEILQLAIRNLVENAIIYGPSGQAVKISHQTVNGCSMVQIVDEGPGLSEADAAALRKRFVRGPRSSAPGSGLGLSIVDAGLNRINGWLRFEALSPRGTCATIVLPTAISDSLPRCADPFEQRLDCVEHT